MTRARVVRAFLGAHPRALLPLLVPTGLAVFMDAVLRGSSILGFALQGKAIYGSSLLISAALWGLPLWCADAVLEGRGRRPVRTLLGVLVFAWLFSVATMGYAGQGLYQRVCHAYMGRDTLRLGIALRGTVIDWFVAWGTVPLLGGMLLVGAVLTFVFVSRVRRARPARDGGVPWLLVVTFVAALGCLWEDQLDSRFLQAATPDACFVHGIVHAVRIRLAGQEWMRQGVSIRNPSPLPPLVASHVQAGQKPPNVLVVLMESVRADAICSDPPPRCLAPFLDAVVPDRVPLGVLGTQTPNTFSSFLVLTTGLNPNADFASAHAAPVLWELARAVGYRTAYISAQNPKYEDFGTFVERAGIDVLVTATDLGGMEQEQLGAPDERATASMLRFIEASTRANDAPPYFGVVHLSNTHAPYRVDPAVMPFVPEAPGGLGDTNTFHNHYRNSVRLEERTISEFLAKVKELPSWDDTVVVLLSDHGEQFREHGGLFHNHSLYDEELRVPGWVRAGPKVLRSEQRAALTSYAQRRTYAQDVHATLVDLLGLYDSRAHLPQASLVGGRSLLRPWREDEEPWALLATSTAVWEPDDARYGVMHGDRVLITSAPRSWTCFDLRQDPGEHTPLAPTECRDLREVANRAFGRVAGGTE